VHNHNNKPGLRSPFLLTRLVHFHAAIRHILSPPFTPGDGDAIGRQTKAPRGAAGVALSLLREAIDEAGEASPTCAHIPHGARTCRTSMWRSYCYHGTVTESDKPASKQKAFVRACHDLQDRKIIGIWDEFVWIK